MILLVYLIFVILIVILLKKKESFNNYIDDTYTLNKYNIWKIYNNNYGRDIAKNIMPDTYLIPKDLELFNKNYDRDDLFILKTTYGSLRNGLNIMKKSDIGKEEIKKYNIIQKYIINLKLINGYIFHIRLFIIIDCKKGIFLFNNGNINYNTNKFDINNITIDTAVTHVANKNNLTHEFYKNNNLPSQLIQLEKIFGKNNYDKMLNNMINHFKMLFLKKKMCLKKINKDKKTTHLYGPDIIVLDDYSTRLCEINKFPATNIHFKPFREVNKKILNDYESENYEDFVKLQ